MLQSFFMRAVAFALWVPAIILTYFLVLEFSEGQSQIIVGIALISLAVSCIGLLNARYGFKRGDRLWGWGSLGMYALAFVVMCFLELGYWNSTIMGSHVNASRAEAAREGVELLKERQREQIRSGRLPETAAEIQAKMDVQLATPIGNQPLSRITANCTNEQSAAYRLCGEFLELKAAKARAQRAEAIEKATWDAGTSVELSGLKRDIFSGANAASNLLGGSPQLWAGLFSLAMMLLLVAVRDLSGLGAFGPGIDRYAARAKAEAEVIQDAGVQPGGVPTPAIAPVEPAEAPASPAPLPDALPTPEAIAAAMRPFTPPSNGGTRRPAPAPQPVADAIGDEDDLGGKVVRITGHTAVTSLPPSIFFEESTPPAKRHTAARRRNDQQKRAKGAATTWLSEWTERSPDPRVTISRQAAWDHYRRYCELEGLREMPQSTFHRTVSARVGSAPGKGGYIGLVLLDMEPQALRAVG